jgi:sialidase-1
MPLKIALSRVLLGALVSFLPAMLRAAASASASSALVPLHESSVVWERDTHGYTIFKVPTLVTDRERKILLAISEGRVDSMADDAVIHLVLRRSFDAGKSWSDMSVIHKSGKQTVGNPTPVVDRETGIIWLFFCVDNKEVWLTSTADAGLTWAPPTNLTSTLKRPEQTKFYATGPGHGIQLERAPKRGRLLITAYASQSAVPPNTSGSKSFAIYSDDHGKTWQAGQVTQESVAGGPDGNECMAAELSDGRLYLTIRNNLTQGGRGYSTSDAAGTTWSPVRIEAGLPEPVCEASLIAHRVGDARATHFYTAPSVSAKGRKDKSARRDVSIWRSTDDCVTWKKEALLWSGPSAYSDMAVLADGTLCVILEAGQKRYDDKVVVSAFRVTAP